MPKMAVLQGMNNLTHIVDAERVLDIAEHNSRLHIILKDGNPIPLHTRSRTEASKILYNAS